MRARKQLKLYDSLKREHKDNDVSRYKGDKGTYVFKLTGETQARKPVTQVYLNRDYMTGLFRSKNRDEYTGDIKSIDSKKYLLFRVVQDGKIDIFEKV